MRRFLTDESGASAAEYALIIALVGVGLGGAAFALGNNITAAIGNTANEVSFTNAGGSSGSGGSGSSGGSSGGSSSGGD